MPISFSRLMFLLRFLGPYVNGCILSFVFSLVVVRAAVPQVHGTDALDLRLREIAAAARPGTFAIAIMDLQTGARWGVDPDSTMPMMSDFKAPVVAAVLAQIQSGRFSFHQEIRLPPKACVPGAAVPSVGEQACNSGGAFILDQLMRAAVSQSDNTAVDALIGLLGGPKEVTRFLQRNGIRGMRVRMNERQMAQIFEGRKVRPPLDKGGKEEKSGRRLRIGYAAFLADPPNTVSPNAAILFLQELWSGQLLHPKETRYLISLMEAQTVPHRLRDGISAPARFADKTGTGALWEGRIAAYNDIGLILWPDGRALAIAAYLKDSSILEQQREALFADLARAAAARLQQ